MGREQTIKQIECLFITDYLRGLNFNDFLNFYHKYIINTRSLFKKECKKNSIDFTSDLSYNRIFNEIVYLKYYDDVEYKYQLNPNAKDRQIFDILETIFDDGLFEYKDGLRVFYYELTGKNRIKIASKVTDLLNCFQNDTLKNVIDKFKDAEQIFIKMMKEYPKIMSFWRAIFKYDVYPKDMIFVQHIMDESKKSFLNEIKDEPYQTDKNYERM